MHFLISPKKEQAYYASGSFEEPLRLHNRWDTFSNGAVPDTSALMEFHWMINVPRTHYVSPSIYLYHYSCATSASNLQMGLLIQFLPRTCEAAIFNFTSLCLQRCRGYVTGSCYVPIRIPPRSGELWIHKSVHNTGILTRVRSRTVDFQWWCITSIKNSVQRMFAFVFGHHPGAAEKRW